MKTFLGCGIVKNYSSLSRSKKIVNEAACSLKRAQEGIDTDRIRNIRFLYNGYFHKSNV